MQGTEDLALTETMHNESSWPIGKHTEVVVYPLLIKSGTLGWSTAAVVEIDISCKLRKQWLRRATYGANALEEKLYGLHAESRLNRFGWKIDLIERAKTGNQYYIQCQWTCTYYNIVCTVVCHALQSICVCVFFKSPPSTNSRRRRIEGKHALKQNLKGMKLCH